MTTCLHCTRCCPLPSGCFKSTGLAFKLGWFLLRYDNERTNEDMAKIMTTNTPTNSDANAYWRWRTREEFEKWQEKMNAMNVNHYVSASYPHIASINAPKEKLVLLDIHRASERYAPRPLIASKAVEANSGRTDKGM